LRIHQLIPVVPLPASVISYHLLARLLSYQAVTKTQKDQPEASNGSQFIHGSNIAYDHFTQVDIFTKIGTVHGEHAFNADKKSYQIIRPSVLQQHMQLPCRKAGFFRASIRLQPIHPHTAKRIDQAIQLRGDIGPGLQFAAVGKEILRAAFPPGLE
jgi:hypothetical protein